MTRRILTGMRPTGKLHLGHYAGALEVWKRYQDEGYECYFLIADYQALGDNTGKTAKIRESVRDVVLDWLAVGLDPDQATFVVQSYAPQHAELTMLLSTITPQGWLDSNPTVKEESKRLTGDQLTIGFMTYPISQVADILLPRANLVPAGEDQRVHVEFTARVARRFNRIYGGNIFPVPELITSETPRLVGTDGENKMGKSLNNAIFLSDTPDEVAKKVRRMKTDPNRIHADVPGTVEGNVPFVYLDAFDPDLSGLAELKERYRAGAVQDVAVKARLTTVLNDLLDPIRERRQGVARDPCLVHDILRHGSDHFLSIAEETMGLVRDAMGIVSYGR